MGLRWVRSECWFLPAFVAKCVFLGSLQGCAGLGGCVERLRGELPIGSNAGLFLLCPRSVRVCPRPSGAGGVRGVRGTLALSVLGMCGSAVPRVGLCPRGVRGVASLFSCHVWSVFSRPCLLLSCHVLSSRVMSCVVMSYTSMS